MARSRAKRENCKDVQEQLRRTVRSSAKEQERLNAELQERIERLAALHRISLAANDWSLNSERVLNLVLAEAIKILHGDSGAIFHLGENDTLHVEVAMGECADRIRSVVVPVGKGIVGHAAATGQPEIVPDVLRDPRYLLIVEGVRSEVTAPLLTHGSKVIGVINIESKRQNAFTQDDLEVLTMLASHAARVWDNATLYEALRRRNQELSDSYSKLREAQEKLMRQERLAVLGQMAAIVAHEIRNPLTSVRGFAQRIARRVAADEKAQQYCRIIVDEVDKLNQVTKSITDFAGRPTPQLQPARLQEVLDRVLLVAEPDATKKDIALEKRYGPSEPLLLDPNQMTQVFFNVVRNAIQASPAGGKVAVEVETVDGEVRISISDTGPGISEDVRQHMFEPFFTTKTHGTGLGLALAQKIVEGHNGRIEVESPPGAGATFTIILPARRPEAIPAASGVSS